MTHSKPHLPEKICQHCQRPFSWRKKWSRCWHEVRYCSKRCKLEDKSVDGVSNKT